MALRATAASTVALVGRRRPQHSFSRFYRIGPTPAPILASTARVHPRPPWTARSLWPAAVVGGVASLAFASYELHNTFLRKPLEAPPPAPAAVPDKPETYMIQMGDEEFEAYLDHDATGQPYNRLARTPDLYPKLLRYITAYSAQLEAQGDLEGAYYLHRRVLDICRRYSDLTLEERTVRLTVCLNTTKLADKLRSRGHAGWGTEEEEDRLVGAVYDATALIEQLQFQDNPNRTPGGPLELDFARLQMRFPNSISKADLVLPFVMTGDLYASQGKSEGAVACYVLAVNVLLAGNTHPPRVNAHNEDLPDMEFGWELFVEPEREASFEQPAQPPLTIRVLANLRLSFSLMDKLGVDYAMPDDDGYDLWDLDREHDGGGGSDILTDWLPPITRWVFDDEHWQALMVALLEEGSLRAMACDERMARMYVAATQLPGSSGDREGEFNFKQDGTPVDRIDWESRSR